MRSYAGAGKSAAAAAGRSDFDDRGEIFSDALDVRNNADTLALPITIHALVNAWAIGLLR